MDNMDYDYCFRKGIHVLATSPVFAQPVAEMAMGLTLSIARSIHIAHSDFILKKEKYGGAISQNNFLIKNKTIYAGKKKQNDETNLTAGGAVDLVSTS